MKILNLTQHQATQEQVEAGVIGFANEQRAKELKSLITFTTLPSANELYQRAKAVVALVKAEDATIENVMVGGAGYFMPILEEELRLAGINPLHSFTQRETVETTNENGEVVKTSKFVHVGFVSTQL